MVSSGTVGDPSLLASLITALIISGVVLGGFFALLLMSIPGRRQRPNRYLALFFCAVSLLLFSFLLGANGFGRLSVVFNPLYFAVGPLLYGYLTAWSPGAAPSDARKLLHGLPAFLAFIYYSVRTLGSLAEDNPVYPYPPDWLGFAIWFAILVQFFAYLVLSIRKLRAGRGDPNGAPPASRPVVEAWFRFLLRFLSALALVLAAGSLYDAACAVGLLDRIVPTELAFAGFAAAMICAGSFYALRCPGLVFGFPDLERPRVGQAATAEDREVLGRVRILMARDKPFLDPELTLPMLADMAGITRGELSRAINTEGNENFYDFVNRYRVEEVKGLFAAPEHAESTILELALAAGFNSKSAFNKAFKRFAGTTPGLYRERSSVRSS